MNIDHNPYQCYANQELKWLPMDTENLYKRNLKVNYFLLEKFNWLNSNFTYKFNSQGFRCDEFTNSPSIVFLGCSITVGIGIPVETTWASLVSNQLNLSCYNLGIGGSSNNTAFRLAHIWLKKIKPKVVVFCQTYPERLEVFNENGIISNIASDCGEFYNHWLSNENNSALNQIKNRLAIQQLCNSFDIKFVHTSVHNFEFIDQARDLAHPGITSNQKFSKLVLELI